MKNDISFIDSIRPSVDDILHSKRQNDVWSLHVHSTCVVIAVIDPLQRASLLQFSPREAFDMSGRYVSLTLDRNSIITIGAFSFPWAAVRRFH